MKPSLRRLARTVHLTASVGILGSVAAFLVLAFTGVTSENEHVLRSVYPAMELIARLVIVPLMLASLLTGLVQSLGTSWGLFRDYWVVVKMALTGIATVILLLKIQLIDYVASFASEVVLSREELRAAGMQLLVHAAGGLLVLLVPAALSVYKPWGLTRYGRRKQPGMRVTVEREFPPLKARVLARSLTDLRQGKGSIAVSLRRTTIIAALGVIVAVHLFILHLSGSVGHH